MNPADPVRPCRVVLLPLLVLAGCTGPGDRPRTDDEKIVVATLGLLASDRRVVCVDDRTHGQPLTVFRTMADAPRASRRPLAWRPPAPLRPPGAVTNRAIYGSEWRDRQVLLPEPVNPVDRLPSLEQIRLNGQALLLSDVRQTESVGISPRWPVAGLVARWWPVNRLRGDCDPRFQLSNPVRTRTTAFITVTSAHWGTTYALEPQGGTWRPTAQWSTWLY